MGKMERKPQDDAEKKAQKKIGKYELIAKIAQGGMGALYTAKHPTLDRVVLLKKLSLRGGEQFVERFKREARLMMDFKNDHIVQVYDHFKEGPSYYIVEEFVDGISLDALIKKERYLSNDAVMLILYEVCRALKYAHDKQVIHRDIKPANILISNKGEVKLVDFGIATSEQETEDGLTKDGMMLGTPAYIPPEQIEDSKNVDRRADIYSLGVVIYEMLTGKTPFPGSFTAETINLIHKGRYMAPKRLNPKISPLLKKIVRKAMRVKPKRRYQDLKEIIKILEKRIRRRDPASILQAMRNVLQGKGIKDIFKRRRTWLAWLVSIVLLGGAIAGAGYYLYREGYYYEYLVADSYGALVVSARIDASYKEAKEVLFNPVLYREDGTTLTPLTEIDFGLAEDASKSSAQSFVLKSKKLYLEMGRYRLMVSLEGQLSWYSFSIEPRAVQKQLLSTLDGLTVNVTQGAGDREPLDLGYTVKDADSGVDLTGSAAVTIFVNGRRTVQGLTGGETLMTGAAYKIQAEKDGYYPQTYDIQVKSFQTHMRLDMRLVPHPGTLTLRSTAYNISVLLNGANSYFTGGLKREFKKIDPLGFETRPLVLSPGKYALAINRGSATQTVNVDVRSDKSVTVEIAYDAAKNLLSASLKD
jgi:serine/threonine-protein kinase